MATIISYDAATTPNTVTVGMGATIHLYSDSKAYTVIAVSPNGKKVTLQRDQAVRIDNNGMCGPQDYKFTPDPNGEITQARLTNAGTWYEVGAPASKGGRPLTMGYRLEHYDFCF